VLAGRVDEVAPRLLGARIASWVDTSPVALRVVEVEAYGGEDDPASHACRGATGRNLAMFAEPGTAYVYFSYGVHWCLNVTVGPAGRAGAVLLRAGEVVTGIEVARDRRTPPSGRPPRDRDLARGPGRLTQALGVSRVHDGTDLLDGGSVVRLTLPDVAVAEYLCGPRVGINRAADRPWRFWLPDEPAVSAYRGGTGTRGERSER